MTYLSQMKMQANPREPKEVPFEDLGPASQRRLEMLKNPSH
jgi:hypothetical protein